MAYLYPNQDLGLGKKSKSYIISDETGIRNLTRKKTMTYEMLFYYHSLKDRNKAIEEIGEELEVKGAELERLCSTLFSEVNEGKFRKYKKNGRDSSV